MKKERAREAGSAQKGRESQHKRAVLSPEPAISPRRSANYGAYVRRGGKVNRALS